MLTGPDASHHQGNVNWAAVRQAGHSFAFIKATEGTHYSFTGWFHDNLPPLRASGLVPGAYHFLRSDTDPAAQARFFVETVGDVTNLLTAVDVETGTNNSRPTADQVRVFAGQLRQLIGTKTLIVYTGRWYWRDTIGNPLGEDIGPLWHSAFSSSPGAMYGQWPAPTFWQHTSSGSCPGIGGHCDLNQFFGTADDLAALAGSPEEEHMALSDDDLKRIVMQLQPVVQAASDTAAKRLGNFLQGRTNSVFNPHIDGNEWMSKAVSLPQLLAAAGSDPHSVARRVAVKAVSQLPSTTGVDQGALADALTSALVDELPPGLAAPASGSPADQRS